MEQYLDPKSIIFTSRVDAEIVLQYLKDLIKENYRWYEGKEWIDYLPRGARTITVKMDNGGSFLWIDGYYYKPGAAMLSELYEIIDKDDFINKEIEHYGWTNLNDTQVKNNGPRWYIDFPDLEEL